MKLNKDMITDTAATISRKVSGAAQAGVENAKRLAAIAKLRAANRAEEQEIKKAYMEIGKLYYAERGEEPEGPYVGFCSRIAKARDAISANIEQIEQLKVVPEVSEEDFAEEIVDESDFAEEEPTDVPPEEPEVTVEEPVVEAEVSEEEADPIPDEE